MQVNCVRRAHQLSARNQLMPVQICLWKLHIFQYQQNVIMGTIFFLFRRTSAWDKVEVTLYVKLKKLVKTGSSELYIEKKNSSESFSRPKKNKNGKRMSRLTVHHRRCPRQLCVLIVMQKKLYVTVWNSN